MGYGMYKIRDFGRNKLRDEAKRGTLCVYRVKEENSLIGSEKCMIHTHTTPLYVSLTLEQSVATILMGCDHRSRSR
jgi:hypothetical protein